jgi:hypothetical protein
MKTGGAGGGDRTHTPLRVLDFESSASASSATPAFRADQKLRRSSSACKPRGGPSTSRRIIPWRTLLRLRSNVPNDWRGIARKGAAGRGIGDGDGTMTGRGGARSMGGATSATTGSKGTVVGGGGSRSLGVVTRGGKGCTQLRLALGLWAGGAAGVTTRRGRTGDGAGFLAAHRALRENGGFVPPRSAAADAAWKDTRRLVFDRLAPSLNF